MPNYKAYPKEKDTQSRRSRKGLRNSVFQFNKTITHKRKKADREARQ